MAFVSLELLDDIATIATAFAAIAAMWAVGKQEWRSTLDMQSRRVALAILAIVSMTHFMSPEKLPEVAQQLSFFAFLVVIAAGNSHKSWHT